MQRAGRKKKGSSTCTIKTRTTRKGTKIIGVQGEPRPKKKKKSPPREGLCDTPGATKRGIHGKGKSELGAVTGDKKEVLQRRNLRPQTAHHKKSQGSGGKRKKSLHCRKKGVVTPAFRHG